MKRLIIGILAAASMLLAQIVTITEPSGSGQNGSLSVLLSGPGDPCTMLPEFCSNDADDLLWVYVSDSVNQSHAVVLATSGGMQTSEVGDGITTFSIPKDDAFISVTVSTVSVKPVQPHNNRATGRK